MIAKKENTYRNQILEIKKWIFDDELFQKEIITFLK